MAEKIFVAYAATGSKTETLCRAVSKLKKPRFTFPGKYTENLRNMGFPVVDAQQ